LRLTLVRRETALPRSVSAKGFGCFAIFRNRPSRRLSLAAAVLAVAAARSAGKSEAIDLPASWTKRRAGLTHLGSVATWRKVQS